MKKLLHSTAAITLAVSLSACGSKAPRPVSELALADSALKSAESSGAREYAPLELRIAREKKVAADKAMAEKKYLKARQLTDQALADAELARAVADAEKSRLALKEAQDNIEMIRKEVQRTNAGK
jgi:predicted small lipoprotein YifL